ncbi:MAG: molybdenum cofactor guanylyltransferase [Planctomycetales bacterium]
MRRAGIILCGGHSTRMGLAKESLPFGPETMLQRVVRILRPIVDQIVVVAAAGQSISDLPEQVEVVHDRQADRGPLEGIATGLAAINGKADAAYATSCDVPLLVPAFVERMFELLGDAEIAVPREGKFHHPLAAVYRVSVLAVIEHLLEQGRLRPVFLYEEVATNRIAPHQWQDVDAQSKTLANLNRPKDYLDALEEAGFSAPAEILGKLAN